MIHVVDAYGIAGGVIKPTGRDPNIAEIAKSMPGLRRWVNGQLTFQGSSHNWAFVEQHLGSHTWTKQARERLNAARTRGDIESEVVRKKQLEDLPEEATRFPFKTTPHKHQLRAWWMSRDVEAFAYFMEQGTGKTKTMIDVAAWLYSVGEIDAVMVIAPNGVHVQWMVQQVPEHCPDFVKPLCAPPLYTSLSAKDEAAVNAAKKHVGLVFFAINCEALAFANGEKRVRDVLLSRRCLLVVDESQKFKNHTASRTKALYRLARGVKYRRILSGTPVTNGVEDLYAQLLFLTPDVLPVGSYTSFVNRYCITGGYQGTSVIGYRNMDELTSRLDPYSFRVRKEDCLDLPDKIYSERVVLMSTEHQKHYVSLRDDLMAQLEESTVTVNHAGAALTKLQQLASGYITDPDGNVLWQASPNPKVSALLEVIEESPDAQFIVWCRFVRDVDMVMEALKSKKIICANYDGRVDEDTRQQVVDGFQGGSIRAIVATGALAVGRNLQAATLMIYFSNTFDAETRWQSEDRAHRFGQTKHVLYVDLVLKGTIDRRIIQALKNKQDVAARTLGDFKQLLQDDEWTS